MNRSRLGALVISAMLCAPLVDAQQTPPAAPDLIALAKQTQNPVGDLISIPVQFNFNTAGDLHDTTLFNVNVQPVFPFTLTSDWHVIRRAIIPIDTVPGENGISYSFVLRPAINYNFGGGWAMAFSSPITANWDASAGNEWTVPLGLGITKTTVFNGRPMIIGLQYFGNVVHPDGAAATQLRFVLSLLFPEKK